MMLQDGWGVSRSSWRARAVVLRRRGPPRDLQEHDAGPHVHVRPCSSAAGGCALANRAWRDLHVSVWGGPARRTGRAAVSADELPIMPVLQVVQWFGAGQPLVDVRCCLCDTECFVGKLLSNGWVGQQNATSPWIACSSLTA